MPGLGGGYQSRTGSIGGYVPSSYSKSPSRTGSLARRPRSGGGGPGGGAGPSPVRAPPRPAPRPTAAPTRQFGGGRSFQGSTPSFQAPAPQGSSTINVNASKNPQYNALLEQQQQYAQDIKGGTGFAADVMASRIADSTLGAENRARYGGGGGAAQAGQNVQRQQQVRDAGMRGGAAAQANVALGREQMLGGALNSQLGTIMGGDRDVTDKMGIGLGAEGLRQRQDYNQFNQGMQGQQFAANNYFRNANSMQALYGGGGGGLYG